MCYCCVSLQMGHSTCYAYNSTGEIMVAEHTHYGQGPFFCNCGTRHLMHLTKPSGLPGRRPFRAYFAHNGACSRGGSGVDNHNPESPEHHFAKTLLRKHVGRYMFAVTRCLQCYQEVDVVETRSDDCVEIEKTEEEGTRRWRYDCCLFRGRQRLACLEVYKSSKCNIDKVHAQRDVPLAEFHVDDVLRLEDENFVVLWNRLCDSVLQCERCAREARAKAEREAEAARIKAEREAEAARIKAEREAERARIQAERDAELAPIRQERLERLQQAKARRQQAKAKRQQAKAKRQQAKAERRQAEAQNINMQKANQTMTLQHMGLVSQAEPFHTPEKKILATRVTPTGIFKDGLLVRSFI